MSIGLSAKKEKSTKDETIQSKLDPKSRSGLDLLINQSKGLTSAPLVPDLSPGTLAGIEGLGAGQGGIDLQTLEELRSTAAGDYLGLDNPLLQQASDFAAERAATQVGDVFTAGGRTGSPAEAKAIAEGVSSAVAPLAFQQQNLERANQINAAFGLQAVKSQEDVQTLQRQLAQLQANGLIDEQARRKLEEPFRRLGLISQPILGAASLGDKTQTSKAKATGSAFGASAEFTP